MNAQAPIGQDLLSAQDKARIQESLGRAEARRRKQLDSLGSTRHDPVDVAQRETLHRLLAEIRAARERLLDGRYGTCERCDLPIPSARLELLPWTTTCVECTRR